MRFTLFLSRIAFICNVFFLLALLLRMISTPVSPHLVSTVGIIGYGLVLLFNPLVNLIYLFLLLRGKLGQLQPRWLVFANFIFLLLQLQYILFLNGKLLT